MVAHKVNTKWFRERLAEREMSVRRLAKHLELDPSAVSLMLRGRRTMTADEANRISGLLTIPVTEVLAQAGVQIEEDARSMSIRASIDGHSVLHPITAKIARRASAPRDVPAGGLALQVRAAELLQDGWVLFTGAFDTRVQAMFDRLAVLELRGAGRVVGTVKRGYSDDRFNIVPWLGGPSVDDADALSAAPVLWIRPV